MPALQVRDCPEGIYKALSACAEEEHRSLSQQIVVALEDYLERRERQKQVEAMLDRDMPLPPHPWEPGYRAYVDSKKAHEARVRQRREALERIASCPPHIVPDDFPSVEEIVREMRDER